MHSWGSIKAIVVFILACVPLANAEVIIETVAVGNPGNGPEYSGECVPEGFGPCRQCGAVDYFYQIGRFEITAGQYTEFLNAVAGLDTYGLYNTEMWASPYGCKIRRAGSPGSYEYLVDADGDGEEDYDWLDRPVNYISWGDAARFCNWLHNGQPKGAQELTTTEDGSYYLDGATSNGELIAITRRSEATWVIPTENEWYKAAYHKNDGMTGNYWDYQTETDKAPAAESPPGTDMENGSANYFADGLAVGGPYFRNKAGAYNTKPSHSPYGTFDQGGNVWEWNEAVIGPSRGLRGGAFLFESSYLHAANRSISGEPTSEDALVGFRVATFGDCNANGIPDVKDLADGTLTDVDPADGVPDQCGACCLLGSSECRQLIQTTCETVGTYNGDGTVCDEHSCPALAEWSALFMTLAAIGLGLVLFKRPVAMR